MSFSERGETSLPYFIIFGEADVADWGPLRALALESVVALTFNSYVITLNLIFSTDKIERIISTS